MFGQLWRLLVKIFIAAGIILALIFLMELLRVFVLLYRIHPIAGFAFAGILIGGGTILLIHGIIQWKKHPQVLIPPEIPDIEEAGHTEMRDYCKYLIQYLDHLSQNGNLPDELRAEARDRILYIKDVLKAHPLNEDLRMTISKTENKTIAPILKKLGEKSEKEVRHCVRDVMLGVTLNPFPSIDFLIVVYRNMAMVLRVVGIYRSRPTLHEQLGILRDIFVVVATINFLNLNRKLLENLFSQIPIVGRFIDDIGQGVGAGILTSVAGHAAIGRCAAFRGWEGKKEIASLGAHSTRFLADVKELFTKDLLPELKGKIRADIPKEKVDEPGFWEAIAAGTAAAVDLTAKGWDSFIRKPAMVGAQGVATAGTHIVKGVARGGSTVARVSAHHSRSAFRGVTRIFQTFGQRIKYTFIGRRLNK